METNRKTGLPQSGRTSGKLKEFCNKDFKKSGECEIVSHWQSGGFRILFLCFCITESLNLKKMIRVNK